MSNRLRKMSKNSGSITGRGPVVEIKNDQQFHKAVIEAEMPVLIDFWAPWCQPCKMMAPVFEQAAREMQGQVRFAKVNTEATPSLARAFRIASIPSLIVMLDGEVVDATVGVTPKAQLLAMARRALDKKNGVTLVDKVKRLFGSDKPEPEAEAS